jgi:hypothetical protein
MFIYAEKGFAYVCDASGNPVPYISSTGINLNDDNDKLCIYSTSQPLIVGQVYLIRVSPASSRVVASRVKFSASFTVPSVIPLTANAWANGYIENKTIGREYYYSENWFKFTATAATQYIHSSGLSGKLATVVYDEYLRNSLSSSLSSGTQSCSLTPGKVYYVRAYTDYGYGGAIQIKFNTSSTP